MNQQPSGTNSLPDVAPTRPGRRDAILAQAGRMFRAKGYHATSMRDLAKALDLRGSSLYAHVASKEDLLWEIVSDAAAAFEAAADAVPDDLRPPERLEALIRAHLGVVAAELATSTVFFQDWLHLGPERRAKVIAVRDAYQQRFVAVIDAGKATGDFEAEDTRIAALLVLSALNWSYQWLDPGGRLDLDEVARAYTAFLLGGLAAATGPSRGTTPDARVSPPVDQERTTAVREPAAPTERALDPPPVR